QTLLRDHRYWPLVYGGVALFGAVGAAWLLEIMWTKLKTAAWVTASVLLLIAAASPIASSLELPRMQRGTRLLASALSGERRATLSLLRGPLGEQRVVAVPPGLQPHAFSFTGYRFIARDRIMPAIRWQGLALRLKRPAANRRLTTGLGSPRAWRRTARHFSVDVVVTTRPGSRARALRGCRLLPARAKEGYVVVPTSGCGRPLPES
ncbi:MAG TPA: hypothetical protein VE712_00540, partial [Actinomycetota bacterium]|nr:hypothetical protein [Actinomycetota bacterium]